MKSLLSKSERRRIEMMEMLDAAEGWMAASQLTETLGCSERIIREDASELNAMFDYLSIESQREHYRIIFKPGTGLETLNSHLLHHSIAFRLLRCTFFKNYNTMKALADALYISQATLYRLLARINDALGRHYGIHFDTTAVRLEGDEADIRFFYSQYFAEAYGVFDWPFERIDERAFSNFLECVIEESGVYMDFAIFRYVKIVSAVNFIRYSRGYRVDHRSDMDEIYARLTQDAHRFEDAEKRLGIRLTRSAFEQIFTAFVQPHFHYTYTSLAASADHDDYTAASIDTLTRLIHQLSEDNAIPHPDPAPIILNVHNTALLEKHDIYLRPILSDRKQAFIKRLEQNHPDFCRQLHEAVIEYRQVLGRSTDTYIINQLIYTWFVNWEGLVHHLEAKRRPLHLLVLSNHDMYHAEMMADMITHAFGKGITVEVPRCINITKKDLEHSNCDLIITNFALQNFQGPPCIQVSQFPDQSNMLKIREALMPSEVET
ncbi:M protein trans-acting positive regulator PRD domain-containing protein [Salinicoccus sp. RF5]|uniref:M protein trans-acting positive regulator PRD domain-containing protein n=1 Tax=Salinicoccus sp. RF5 TaxID=2748874 RepID=UPI001E4825C7|nr:M protein trans-acting positive regulator PRD domain-containing protein [Salinicoccus sp. RF5]MCC4722324.1 helix-turn-helix domain-containing protein [Salinicoccus sp. RF5]